MYADFIGGSGGSGWLLRVRRTSASSPALAALPSTAAAAFALAVLAASTAALPRVAARTAVASLVPAEEELAVALPTLGAPRLRLAAGIFESSMQPPRLR